MQWMGIQDLGTFVAAVIVFLAIPGPGTFSLLTATGKGGPRAGYATLAGLALGDQILMWLAVIGVAALLKANLVLFGLVKYAGAAYLIWIGVQLLWQRGEGTGPVRMETGRYFRQGILVTLLNPKAIIFYMAFFPLFIDPAHHQGLATFATMAALIAVITLLYCSLLILTGHAMSQRVRQQPRLRRWLQSLAGVFLVGFGVRLGTG